MSKIPCCRRQKIGVARKKNKARRAGRVVSSGVRTIIYFAQVTHASDCGEVNKVPLRHSQRKAG